MTCLTILSGIDGLLPLRAVLLICFKYIIVRYVYVLTMDV